MVTFVGYFDEKSTLMDMNTTKIQLMNFATFFQLLALSWRNNPLLHMHDIYNRAPLSHTHALKANQCYKYIHRYAQYIYITDCNVHQ